MKYPFDNDFKSTIEIKQLDKEATMRRLNKNKPHTWWNGPGSKYPPADLDHVVASNQLQFTQIKGADVDVRGWPAKKNDKAKVVWIKDYSDHGLHYMVVEKV